MTHTGCWEYRQELESVRTVLGNVVPTADEQLAQLLCRRFRELLLLVAVRRADRLWDSRLLEHVAEPPEKLHVIAGGTLLQEELAAHLGQMAGAERRELLRRAAGGPGGAA